MSIDAIFENGVFRPTEPVELAERTAVKIDVHVTGSPSTPANGSSGALDEIYAVLAQRFQSGHSDTAARHNEHQP
jgi:predicted DNA-binding antitoxin AbrB/MazE fold protein